MIRSKWVISMVSVFFICSAIQVFAGELPPPGTIIAPKGKPITGQGTIINIIDDTEGSLGYAFVIVGTCKKQPFKFGPVYIAGGNFGSITVEDFDQFYFPDMVPPECNPPDGYQGYAIVGFDDVFFLQDVISGEAILKAVVPVPASP